MPQSPWTRRNAVRECDWCHRLRGPSASGRYCQRCKKTSHRHGHPGQPWVRPSDYEPFHREARRFLRDHHDHPGIPAAVALIDRWLAEADRKPIKTPAETEASLLQTHGVRGAEVLPRLLAAAFLNEWHPTTFISHSAYIHALGRRCLVDWKRLGRGKRKVPPEALRGCGSYLIRTLGVFLLNAARHWASSKTKQESESTTAPTIQPMPTPPMIHRTRSGATRTDH